MQQKKSKINFSKNYSYYYHHDFDGIASGAVLLYFLKSCGSNIKKFKFMGHGFSFEEWKSLKEKYPIIVTDFWYHPRAEIWFDHHKSTFKKKEWENNFKKDNLHLLDADSDSTCGLIAKHFEKILGIKLNKNLKALVKWADIIDRAKFKSASQAVDLNHPAMQINVFLEESNFGSFEAFLINEFAEKSLKQIVRHPKIKKVIRAYKLKFDKTVNFIKENIVEGKVVFLDTSPKDLIDPRFLIYKLYPSCRYNVFISKHGHSERPFAIHVGSNPWNRPLRHVNIGELLKRDFFGGGHIFAGAANFKTRNQAINAAHKVVEYLNKHV
ncbi:MAG: hypothetical protein PHN74_01080 [Candidatus Pacebacteria bacterium]|nr:hypothetical protein [Candidatus Paceibacterota bacterium]